MGLSVALSAAALELSMIQFQSAIALPSKPAQLEEPPHLSAVQLVVPGGSLAQTRTLIAVLKSSDEEVPFQHSFEPCLLSQLRSLSSVPQSLSSEPHSHLVSCAVGIFRPGRHCLGGHEGGGAWCLRLRHLCGTAGAHVQDLGHAEVRDLGGHAGRQEDVVGGQVAVDDGRRELMEVAQSEGHLQQDAAANLGWEGTVRVQTAAEGGWQVLHHQLRQLGACLHTHAQELDYVRVVELPKQLTLCSKSET